LAQSGHHDPLNQCPLLGVKRTFSGVPGDGVAWRRCGHTEHQRNNSHRHDQCCRPGFWTPLDGGDPFDRGPQKTCPLDQRTKRRNKWLVSPERQKFGPKLFFDPPMISGEVCALALGASARARFFPPAGWWRGSRGSSKANATASAAGLGAGRSRVTARMPCNRPGEPADARLTGQPPVGRIAADNSP